MNALLAGETLEDSASRSLAWHLGVRQAAIATRANSRKYAAETGEHGERSRLTEIFGLMRRLNETAMSDGRIGAAENDPTGLRDLFSTAAMEIAHGLGAGTYHWVELGPEPSKTCHLLRHLASIGSAPTRYTAVDINPQSAHTMRESVGAILPEAGLDVLTKDYDRISRDDIGDAGVPILLTHLGFQEGNDTPVNTRDRLLRLTRPGDLVLSEMQVIADGALDAIGDFYSLPEMRRFSELTARSITSAAPSRYEHFVVPVALDEMPPVLAAVCAHAIEPHDTEGGADPSWVMTNVCIKFSSRQFRAVREHGGHYEVLWQGLTGNRTIALQLARRR